MQTAQRHDERALIQCLIKAPYRFEFAQLLNILLRMLRRRGFDHERAFREVLRFSNSVSLAFPASEVEGLHVDDGMAAGKTAPRIDLTPAFIGLLGGSGALPLHDTERAAATGIEGDESWSAFMNLLSNRVVGQFHQAWGKYRVEHGLNVRGQDDLLPLLTALAGARPQARTEGVPPELPAYYAALLRTRPIAAATVASVLADYFGVPVHIEEFVGGWEVLALAVRSTLGVTKPRLGFGATLGTRQWRHDLHLRLHIGPANDAAARRFRPRGPAWLELQQLAALFAVPTVQYEVRLLLDRDCIVPLSLATSGAKGKQLGWNTFLTSTPGVASRPENRSVLHARRNTG